MHIIYEWAGERDMHQTIFDTTILTQQSCLCQKKVMRGSGDWEGRSERRQDNDRKQVIVYALKGKLFYVGFENTLSSLSKIFYTDEETVVSNPL